MFELCAEIIVCGHKERGGRGAVASTPELACHHSYSNEQL